jgi:hypothetical protein
MKTPGKTTLEGAFELASAGKVTSIGEIQHILKVEGYERSYISWAGPLLKRQLNLRIWSARPDVLEHQRLRDLKRQVNVPFDRSLPQR